MATKVTKLSAKFETNLSLKVQIGQTTATLSSVSDLDGDTLPTGRYGFTVDENNSSVEYFEADVSGTSITNVKGIDPTTLTETTGFVKEHRAGSEVKITDYPVIGRIRALVTGEADLDAGAPLKYDASPTLSSNNQLATVGYVLSIVTGGTVTFDANVVSGVAGETFSSGDWVYLNESDGRWYATDADDTAKSVDVRIGKAKGAGTAGNTISGGVFMGGVETTGTYVAGTKYYLSNTAGQLSTSVGTNIVLVGVGDANADLIFVNIYDPESVTQKQKDALVGSSGVPSTTNKYITQDNVSASGVDQSQTTQNNSIEVGEANATTRKNKIAQSFIAGKTRIRGVNIYKTADSGTFTGTVTVGIQADSSGSPSGTSLVSTTTQWSNLSAGVNEIPLTEYSSLVQGTTYWIVFSSSTADNANHPNIGGNSAGGYSGTLKYNNTTDGWVAISGQDIYFETLEGTASQVVKTNSSGKIESSFFSTDELPKLAPMQDIARGNVSGTVPSSYAGTSSIDGSVFYALIDSQLVRYARESSSGIFYRTHSVSSGDRSIVLLGDYVYGFADGGANVVGTRYLASDLTGATAITFSASISATGSCINSYTDGTYVYIQVNSGSTFQYYSVSGTTFTFVSSITADTDITQYPTSFFYDGSGIIFFRSAGVGSISYGKFTNGTSVTASTRSQYGFQRDGILNASSIPETHCLIICAIDSTRIYIGVPYNQEDSTQYSGFIKMIPISKPQ